MEDLFKKVINAGVGFVSLTTDRVQTTIDKLVQESKLSEKEGRKIMDDLKKNAETKRKEFEKQVTGVASKVLKGVGVAPASELEDLKRTVKGTKAAPAAKKAAPAKAPVASATSKAAGAVKKAADKTSAAAAKTQKSAAAKAGAAESEASAS